MVYTRRALASLCEAVQRGAHGHCVQQLPTAGELSRSPSRQPGMSRRAVPRGDRFFGAQ